MNDIPDPLDEYIRLTAQTKRRDTDTKRICFEHSILGLYETHFDFEEASRAWKRNKREPWKGIFVIVDCCLNYLLYKRNWEQSS